MSTPAQIAANIVNAQSSTGPRTPEGRANSSHNATTWGLFTQTDFIRSGEENAYAELDETLQNDLAPSGPLEHTLVAEIRRTLWRLSRCGEVEAGFAVQLATGIQPIPDPMQDEAAARLQNSVDRARAQSHRLLHRCTAELRKLQTERFYRNEIFPPGTDLSDFGLADWRSITKSLAESTRSNMPRRKLDGLDNIVSIPDRTNHDAAHQGVATTPAVLSETPITNQNRSAELHSPETPRNTPCPCNSGLKYKRCCGRKAPAMLHAA